MSGLKGRDIRNGIRYERNQRKRSIKLDLISKQWAKLYMPSTLNIDLILSHTQLIVCAENLNHGLNQGFFLSLFKLILCPKH